MYSFFKQSKPVEEAFEELKKASEELISIYEESLNDATLTASSSFSNELIKIAETMVACVETAKEERAAGERIIAGNKTTKTAELKFKTDKFLEDAEEWS